MSWTQVYLTGLSKSIEPSDEELESQLDVKYNLSNDGAILWAGPGTTLIKRDDHGCCRGFAFLAFYSDDGAAMIIDRVNNCDNRQFMNDAGEHDEGAISEMTKQQLPDQLHAELSKPKAKKKGNGGSGNKNNGDLPDLRLRRQRKAPIRKHPVIVSSNRKKTNLGNKNR